MTTPRICLCVMMNHPFPRNLPLLRRIYAGRFSQVVFLIPFERMPDEDVITVYRGSYAHAAYLTDAYHRLRQVDCDYFVVVHDDVMINPRFDEGSFSELFPLGPDDAFIPWVHQTPNFLTDWIWYYALLPKLLHPKSLLFGSGIEPGNLLRYLPDAAVIADGFRRSGAAFCDTVRIGDREEAAPNYDTMQALPGVVLLDGLAAQHDVRDSKQQKIEAESLAALTALTAAIGVGADRDGLVNERGDIQLPIPLAASAYYTDFYILPKSRMADFVHHMGVAGSAGLFVEIIVPVLLHATCAVVHTATSLDLDFTGFAHAQRMDYFQAPRAMAIHPYKLSQFREPAHQDGFMTMIETLRAGKVLRPEMAVAAGLDPAEADPMRHEGWHDIEAWGRWASAAQATIRLNDRGPTGILRIELLGPGGSARAFGAEVLVDGVPIGRVTLDAGTRGTIDVGGEAPADSPIRIEILSDRLVSPRETDPASPDERMLGVGLLSITPA